MQVSTFSSILSNRFQCSNYESHKELMQNSLYKLSKLNTKGDVFFHYLYYYSLGVQLKMHISLSIRLCDGAQRVASLSFWWE